MNTNFSIAIDGPSGAGKSTVARAAAERLGFLYVDTGAIYRTVGLAARQAGVGSGDAEGLARLLPELDIALRHGEDGAQRMYLGGEDVSDAIRRPEISIWASDVSALPVVRAFLLDMQRDLAARHSVVMDGRDIGTVVLPDAGLKIFLTASAAERARRRHAELSAKGDASSLEEVLRDMEYRDRNDAGRAAAPLRAAEDAVLLDSTDMELADVVARVCALAKERMGL